MLIKYQLRNNFSVSTAQTITVSGGTLTDASKFITLPVSLDFFPVDYGDDINKLVNEETKKAINPFFDAETTKYIYPDSNVGGNLTITFKFWNGQSLGSTYIDAGFTETEVRIKKNGFKKSFFRLYFYDSNSGETNNLIFTEDLNIYDTTTAILPFNRLYWLRNDDFFFKNNGNKTVYMDASFFNAKTGKVTRFINPYPSGAPPTGPLNILQYSDPNNRDWRTSAITIINPNNNNGVYNFTPLVPFGANQISVITLSEFILS